MNLDSPSTLLVLRDPWGQPLLLDQPDGQRWFRIFNSSTHWWLHSINLAYPDGTFVAMQGRGKDEMPWTARTTYRIYAIVDHLKQWYRRNF